MSKKNRSLVKELTTGAVASIFLVCSSPTETSGSDLLFNGCPLITNILDSSWQGFGSLFLLLSSGVYV